MRALTIITFLISLIACRENQLSRLDFMIGTWKMEGKEQYEVWESENNELNGYSYKIKDGQKTITETLSIKIIDDRIIYEANVPDQNEGKSIRFPLNNDIKDFLSFENMEHDFPKKIQYKKLNEQEIEVTVLGDSGKGFSYVQLKQVSE